jgi:hypothetical protein
MKPKTIITGAFFAQKPSPYHDILNADFPPDLTPDEIVAEITQRNLKVRFAQSVEKAVLKALEEGKLPELESRIANKVVSRLVSRLRGKGKKG